jgi:hypothetical protein
MNERNYAVFLFPQAVETLGEAIKPYLVEGPVGQHIQCHAIDTSGPFVQMGFHARNGQGQPVTLELMLPAGMVRMVASMRNESEIGFT